MRRPSVRSSAGPVPVRRRTPAPGHRTRHARAALAVAALLTLPVQLLAAGSASAEPVALDFDQAPAAPWAHSAAEGATASFDGGVLTLDATGTVPTADGGGGRNMFAQSDPDTASDWVRGVDTSRGWTIEARVHVDPASAPGCTRSISANDHSTSPILFGISSDGICLAFPRGVFVPLETTDGFHDYRIQKKYDQVRIFVDGVLRIDQAEMSDEDRLDPVPYGLAFGDDGRNGLSRTHWDSFSYDVTTPVDDPAFRVVDRTGPDVSVETPEYDATYDIGQEVKASFSCSDPSGIDDCRAVVTHDQSGRYTHVEHGELLDTSTAGSYSVLVYAEDNVGQERRVELSYTVLPEGSLHRSIDGDAQTLTTGRTATALTPLQTSIEVPEGVYGDVSVDAQPTSTPLTGYRLFGQQLEIHGPDAPAGTPYRLSFTIDEAQLAGTAPADVQVWRNGVALADCAEPPVLPCVTGRWLTPQADDGGDALVTILTGAFSTWSLGVADYDLTGPFAPVDAAPTVNTAKAGSAIPVRFRLGGDVGLGVFKTGYPKVVASTGCRASAPRDAVERLVSGGSSALTYDAASATYTYTWKTAKSATGCKDLVLLFRDGSQLVATFQLR